MKISVKGNGHNLRLSLPTKLLFSRFVLRLTLRHSRYIENLDRVPPEKLDVLFAELRRIKKEYKSWTLVEVDSADGEQIRIVL